MCVTFVGDGPVGPEPVGRVRFRRVASLHVPLVSVIMPAFNAGATVGSAIRSALAQGLDSIEVLVADDGSSDATAGIVQELATRDPRVRLLRTAGRTGPARARNTAIAAARGRWLAFLDSDDVWHPEKLARQLALAGRSGASLVYSGYWRVSEDGLLCGKPVSVPASLSYRQLLGNSAIATSTVLLDRQALGTPSMDHDVGYDDFELWTRLLAGGAVAFGVREPLMAYRVRIGSVSRRRVRMSREVWKVLRERRRVPLPLASLCFASYACRAALKHHVARPCTPAAGVVPPEVLAFLRC
jgi:teichuronic acid biosynthesis glycosyltransferase TuaG